MAPRAFGSVHLKPQCGNLWTLGMTMHACMHIKEYGGTHRCRGRAPSSGYADTADATSGSMIAVVRTPAPPTEIPARADPSAACMEHNIHSKLQQQFIRRHCHV